MKITIKNECSEAWIAKLCDVNPGWIHGAAHLTHSTGNKPVGLGPYPRVPWVYTNPNVG